MQSNEGMNKVYEWMKVGRDKVWPFREQIILNAFICICHISTLFLCFSLYVVMLVLLMIVILDLKTFDW